MKKALIRLEDVRPSEYYLEEENLIKLRAIADYLKSENIPFHISVIPRCIEPDIDYDKSISDIEDPNIVAFNNTLQYMVSQGGALGMHGYTHQHGNQLSAYGYEFYNKNCTQDCAPNDSPEACLKRKAFITSYAYSRMEQGFNAFKQSGLNIDWGFSTPHYTASNTQRCIIEAWSGLMFEDNPYYPTRSLSIIDTDTPFYRGVIYVPTPLGYINTESDVNRICSEIQSYDEQDIAGFYYHPDREFSFITVTESGTVVYDEDSYLKRLIRCFKSQGFTFTSLTNLVNFVPSARLTGIFPGNENIFFKGDINGDKKTEFIIWQPENGIWYSLYIDLEAFPSRQNILNSLTVNLMLTSWAIGEDLIPLIGDFNGDDKDDALVWNSFDGSWQVALSNGSKFIPHPGIGDYSWLKNWAIGDFWTPLVGDFNGDGKDDILVWNPFDGDWQVALSNGSEFIPHPGTGDYTWLKDWAVGDFWIPLVGDFNGDGKDDILVWNPFDGGWQVALSNGSEFIPHLGTGDYTWLKNWAVGDFWIPLVGDFNGDGIKDILVVDVSSGDWQVALSNGIEFSPINDGFQPWAAGEDMQPIVADLNGEGRDSIVARHPTLMNGTLDCAIGLFKTQNK